MFHFECIDCGREYKKDELEYVCPACAKKQKPMEPTLGVLKVVYDGASSIKDIHPLRDPKLLPPLKVGPSPLYHPDRLCKELGLKNLYIKDDTGLPTGSFKDRASSLVVAKARELKKDVIVCASTGNAATALSGMCASVGMKCVIFVPEAAPLAKLTQIAAYGAELIPVKGTYDSAFELSIAATKKFGWYNRNTAYNPFTIEGKKSAALEIFEQLGRAPDKIFIPTGDGCILAGIHKGFADLRQLGLIKKLPQLVAVQAEGSCAITRKWAKELSVILSAKGAKNLPDEIECLRSFATVVAQDDKAGAHTMADSICVTAPRNANWAVKAMIETKGFGVTVSDPEIISAIAHLARMTGIFAEPAAAASLAGLVKYTKDEGRRTKDETAVILVTGTGLKDIPAAQKAIKIREPIEPRVEAVPPIC